MKKGLLILASLGAFGFSAAGEIKNPIVKKLLEKGVITKEEAALTGKLLYFLNLRN